MAQTPKTVDIKINVDRESIRNLVQHGILFEALREMKGQDTKWGPQAHRDGTGRGIGSDVIRALMRREGPSDPVSDRARRRADLAAEQGTPTWEQILTEEFFEALEESDPEALFSELVQVAAVALNWATDIRTRTTEEV